MNAREFAEWMYATPDSRTARIRELEAALLESNDTAARLARELRALRFWTGEWATSLAVTLSDGGKLVVLRGHVLFEHPLTEVEIRAVTERRTFRLLMGHGAALNLSARLLDFALLALKQRAQIEATNGNLARSPEEEAALESERAGVGP
jgi:hypothetical protein